MLTTAAGLTVAVPTLFAHNYIMSKIRSLVVELEDESQTLITYPGDEHTLVFELPGAPDSSELFLDSRGYYLEWMREEWLAEEDPLRAMMVFSDPEGTLHRLAPEFKRAEVDLEETVKDERSGGSVFVTLPPESEIETRKRSLRELAVSTPTFCLTPTGSLPPGFSRLHEVLSTKDLEDYHVLLADTPGFRVAVVRRRLPSGGWIALWTGNERAIAEVGRVVQGYLNYHAIPTNTHSIQEFVKQVTRHWRAALRRRSQKDRTSWDRMDRLAERWLPKALVLHPWPTNRFDARTRGGSPVR